MLRSIRFWIALLIALVAGIFLLLISPPLFFRALSLLGVAMMMASAVIMLLTFRKAQRLSALALWISMAISLLAFTIYKAILPIMVSGSVVAIALMTGSLLGIGWSAATEVTYEEGVVKRRGNAWYLAIWALIFALTQLSGLGFGRPPRWTLVMLGLGTGVVLGNSLGLLVSSRLARLRAKS